ncbi:hypothetical protein HZC09_02785 [Candidatus Micrarchaeota archaeon]|nr:hypothetical protein [Candidatus Micrarchaeota archaeon]
MQGEHPIVKQLEPLLKELDKRKSPLIKTREEGHNNAGGAQILMRTLEVSRKHLPKGIMAVGKVHWQVAGMKIVQPPTYYVKLRGVYDKPTEETAEKIREELKAGQKGEIIEVGPNTYLVQTGTENAGVITVNTNSVEINSATREKLKRILSHYMRQNLEEAQPIQFEVYGKQAAPKKDRWHTGHLLVEPEYTREYEGLTELWKHLGSASGKKIVSVRTCLNFRDRTTLTALNTLLEARAEELGVTPAEALKDKQTQECMQAVARNLGKHQLKIKERFLEEFKKHGANPCEVTIPWHET